MTHRQNEVTKEKAAAAAGCKRDITIDILRLLGLIGVILAHCSIPGPLFELREFDVTMLVLASGMSYACAAGKQEEPVTVRSWFSYVVKRFQRLIVPVWIFLVFYFLFFWLVFDVSYDWRYLLSSFALTSSGIQFVWVFRVFFTSAIFNPLLGSFVSKKGTVWSLRCFGVVLVLNEVLIVESAELLPASANRVLSFVLFYTVAYAMISGLGIVLQQMKNRNQWKLLLISAFVWAFFGFRSGWSSLQAYKYPPQLYYIGYGFMVTVFIDLLLSQKKQKEKAESRCLLWLSRHSMDIYLAHILVIYFVQALSLGSSISWVLQFLLYFGCSVVLVMLFQQLQRVNSVFPGKGQGSSAPPVPKSRHPHR